MKLIVVLSLNSNNYITTIPYNLLVQSLAFNNYLTFELSKKFRYIDLILDNISDDEIESLGKFYSLNVYDFLLFIRINKDEDINDLANKVIKFLNKVNFYNDIFYISSDSIFHLYHKSSKDRKFLKKENNNGNI